MEGEKKSKKVNKGLIIGLVAGGVVLVVVIVIIIIVILLRRRKKVFPGCSSDLDCPPTFKCNTGNGLCARCVTNADCGLNEVCDGVFCVECVKDTDCSSRNPGQVCDNSACVNTCSAQDTTCPSGTVCSISKGICVNECTSNADCTTGETCEDGGCFCAKPIISSAFTTPPGTFPPGLVINVQSPDSLAGMYYRATFVADSGVRIGSEWTQQLPVTIPLPAQCDAGYPGYGCPAYCGGGHSIKGKIEVQIKNICGAISDIYTIPASGSCDFCVSEMCQ